MLLTATLLLEIEWRAIRNRDLGTRRVRSKAASWPPLTRGWRVGRLAAASKEAGLSLRGLVTSVEDLRNPRWAGNFGGRLA